jgi:hypothetical protein
VLAQAEGPEAEGELQALPVALPLRVNAPEVVMQPVGEELLEAQLLAAAEAE